MSDFNDMTIKELRAYAKKNKINLEGRDKKADIIATIQGGSVEKPEGQDHIDAIEVDRIANLKALEK